MKWNFVRKRIREIWPHIQQHVPARGELSQGHVKFDDGLVFEAALYLIWRDSSINKVLGHPYPTVHPLHRRIAALVHARALDKLWADYLARLRKDELQAWEDAFAKIQEGRRGGISIGLAWCEILRRGLEDRLGRNH